MEDNIIKGEEFERKISSNLGELAMEALQVCPESIIQIDADTGEQLTASVILQRSVLLAQFLIESGVNHGDTISIMSENRLEFCIVTVAVFFVGATLAPMNPEYKEGELNHVMGISKPKLIFASLRAIQAINDCIQNHDYVKTIILLGNQGEKSVFRNFNDIIEGKLFQSQKDFFDIPHFNPRKTVATILCSSGTSGKPKGVKTTHDNITACIEILCKVINKMEINEYEDETDSIVGVAPFFHSFGFLTMFLHLLRGKTMIVLKKFSPKLFLNTIVEYRVRSLMIPPPLLLFLLKDEVVKKYDLSFVKEIYIGAAAVGKETELELKKRFKIRHAGQSYGMTETTWAVISSPHSRAKVGSVGKILPGMMAKVLDTVFLPGYSEILEKFNSVRNQPEDTTDRLDICRTVLNLERVGRNNEWVIDEHGKSLGAYSKGELCLKGPMVMKGYAEDAASTRSCIDEDNWLHTGDVAYYDDEQYFFIVDRLKELIKYKGFQVSPSELENLLLSHPEIVDAAVIGTPDEYAGELPTAFVVRREEHFLSANDVQKFVSDHVSPQKQLRGGVIFMKEIPRNSNGKILRRVLKENTQNLKLSHKLQYEVIYKSL